MILTEEVGSSYLKLPYLAVNPVALRTAKMPLSECNRVKSPANKKFDNICGHWYSFTSSKPDTSATSSNSFLKRDYSSKQIPKTLLK